MDLRTSGASALRRTRGRFAIKGAAAACGAIAALNRPAAGSDRARTEGQDGQGVTWNNDTGKGHHHAQHPVPDLAACPEPLVASLPDDRKQKVYAVAGTGHRL